MTLKQPFEHGGIRYVPGKKVYSSRSGRAGQKFSAYRDGVLIKKIVVWGANIGRADVVRTLAEVSG